MTRTKDAIPTPLREKDVEHPNVKSLIQSCDRITNGRIFVHRWNIEKEYAPIGLAVAEQDVATLNRALEVLIGKARPLSSFNQFDLESHSKTKGTHLNVYPNGKLELQGGQRGEGKEKRFPPSTRYACQGFLDILHHVSAALESTNPLDTNATKPKSFDTGNITPETDLSEPEKISLERMKFFLSKFPPGKKELILKSLQDSDNETPQALTNLEPGDELTNTELGASLINSEPGVAAPILHPALASVTSTLPGQNRAASNPTTKSNTVQYKVQPVIVHHNFPSEIRDNPNEIKKSLNKLKPDCKIKEVKTLKSGDLLIIGESEKDYNSLLKPWDTSLCPEGGEIKVRSRLPDEKSISHDILIRSVPTSVTDEEIKESLLLENITPKSVTRFVYRSGEKLKTVKVSLGLRSEKDQVLNTGVKIGYESFKCIEFKEQENITQCFRCQKFNHTSHLCEAPVRCVRCSENHRISEECKNAAVKCANCNESHYANYKGCSFYKTAVATTSAVTRETRPLMPHSYADVTASAPALTQTKPQVDSHLVMAAMAECMHKLSKLYKPDIQDEDNTIEKVVCDVGKRFFSSEISPESLVRLSNSTHPRIELIKMRVESARQSSSPSGTDPLPSLLQSHGANING